MAEGCGLLSAQLLWDWVWLVFCIGVFAIGSCTERELDQQRGLPKSNGRRFRVHQRSDRLRMNGRVVFLVLLLGSTTFHVVIESEGRLGCLGDPMLWYSHGCASFVSEDKWDRRLGWIQPNQLFYLHHLRSCAASPWGATRGCSSSTNGLGTDVPIMYGILSPLRMTRGRFFQGLYLGTLCWWTYRVEDRLRCVVSGISMLAWVFDFHFDRSICRGISVLGGFWLSKQMPIGGRLLLLAIVGSYPAFPREVASSTLGGVADMEVDEDQVRIFDARDSVGADAELAELFGCGIEEIQQLARDSLPSGPRSVQHTLYCPIAGCARSRGVGPAWQSKEALRAHVDLHCIGELQGRPSDAWFHEQRWQGCRVCGKTLSTRIASGVHAKCWPQVRPSGHLVTPHSAQDDLPTLQDIFTCPIFTKDYLPAEVWPLVRIEYAKLLSAVVSQNRLDAWDPLPTEVGGRGVGDDTVGQAQARRAWIELLMFPKSVCRQNRRGQRRGQAIAFTKSLLTRWRLGERKGLWDEAVMAARTRKPRGDSNQTLERREAEVRRLVALGRSGQAMKRLVSPGLAASNEQIRQKLLAKFPPSPAGKLQRTALPPTPEIPLDVLFQSLKSFPTGSGPGPDGLRADFLKGFVGHSLDSEYLMTLHRFIRIVVDAELPEGLRPWMAGGTLVGVGKVDKSGHPVALDQDARPIVMGQVFRKLAFKCSFRLDSGTIKARLLPRQLAVAVGGGAEALVHSTRMWVAQNKCNQDMVLLQKDVKNAFNTVHPHEFLIDCRQYAPASSRFAEWCYGAPSHLVYEGELYPSSRGQQGCPLMMALFCLVRRRHAEEAREAAGSSPPFEPEYADDSFSGGRVQDVLRCFREEIKLAEKYGFSYDLSQCTLYLLAGDEFRGDVSGFQALGVRIQTGTDIQMLKAPVCGQTPFMKELCDGKIVRFEQLFRALEQLQSRHVAFHLLQKTMGFCQLQFLARTSPRHFLEGLFTWYDARYRQALENILGRAIPDVSWRQACLHPKHGGLGLTPESFPIGDHDCHRADIAYVVASRFTSELCAQLVTLHPNYSILGWAVATQRLEALCPTWKDAFQRDDTRLKFQELVAQGVEASRRTFLGTLSSLDLTRMKSYGESWADGWVCSAPNLTFGTCFTNVAFSDALSMRLGLQVFDGDEGCGMCPQVSDSWGHHCIACPMIGKTPLHNCVRDEIFRGLSGGGIGLKLEPSGLLPATPDLRPADILTIPTPLCRQSAWNFLPRVALDFAIVSQFIAGGSVSNTERYAEQKRTNRQIQQRCHEQGIGFEPIVFDYAGGLNVEGRRILDSLCKAADEPLGRPPGRTRSLLQERISILLQRHVHVCLERRRTVHRREPEILAENFVLA